MNDNVLTLFKQGDWNIVSFDDEESVCILHSCKRSYWKDSWEIGRFFADGQCMSCGADVPDDITTITVLYND